MYDDDACVVPIIYYGDIEVHTASIFVGLLLADVFITNVRNNPAVSCRVESKKKSDSLKFSDKTLHVRSLIFSFGLSCRHDRSNYFVFDKENRLEARRKIIILTR
jgi:hypothetical protein